MSIVIENIFVVTVGGRFRALPPVIPTQPVNFFGLATTSAFDILSLVTAVVFLVGLQLFLTKTKWGLAIRAASYNLKTAGLMGVNVNRLIGIVFFVAGLLAGVGGIFLSVRYTLYPQLGMIVTKGFCCRCHRRTGFASRCCCRQPYPWFGGDAYRRLHLCSQFRDLVVFGLLIVTLIIRPTGLFGKSVGEKV